MIRFFFIFCTLLLFSTAFAQNAGIKRLGAELQSPNTAIRRQAAIGLGRASHPQSVRLLHSALSTERQTSIRLEIVRALSNIAFLRYPGYKEALKALGDAANDAIEPDGDVRLRATEALWEAGKKDLLNPVPFLNRNLDDKSLNLRFAAVKMLRKLGTPEAIPGLGKAALDKTQAATIRLKAIEALGAISLFDLGPLGRRVAENNIEVANRLGSVPIVDLKALTRRHELQISYLASVVRDPDNSNSLALQAIKSIGRVKDKSSIPVLREVIETHQSPAVRKQAIRILSHVLASQYE